MTWRRGTGQGTPTMTSQYGRTSSAVNSVGCPPPDQPDVHIEGVRKESLEIARNRLLTAAALFSIAFLVLAGRLLDLGLVQQIQETRTTRHPADEQIVAGRGNIVDRNGVILATNLVTHSLYADPKRVLDAGEAADKLVGILPGLSRAGVYSRLTSNARFVWIKRKLTPEQMWEVNRLGLPGFAFQKEEQRIYPQGRLAAHTVGYVDIDGKGLAGIEGFFDDRLRDPARAGKPLKLALDVRVQYVLRDALMKSMQTFQAIGAAGIVMNVNTGAVEGLVSLPDFDPNDPGAAPPQALFNRAVQGVYEMGSGLKIFTIAMGLESGVVTVRDGYDATNPIHISRFTIRDDHPKKRWLSIPEILVYSSNIGSAKLAMDVGTAYQREFLGKAGLLRKSPIELREAGSPLVPDPWREINTMTIAFGHGLAISPLQLANGAAAIVNGGRLIPATLIAHNEGKRGGTRVVSAKTSDMMRKLLRLVVLDGTGENADVPGYLVGGKTGTAEKSSAHGYRRHALVSSFIGIFPMDKPQYVVLAMLDEPKGTADTFNFATGGWTAAPVVAEVISRIGPILGVKPRIGPHQEMVKDTLLVPTGG